MQSKFVYLLGVFVIFAAAVLHAQDTETDAVKSHLESLIKETQSKAESYNRYDLFFPPNTEIVSVDQQDGRVVLTFNRYLGYRPWHPDSASAFMVMLGEELADLIPADAEIDVKIRYGGREYTDYDFDVHITTPEKIRARQDERQVPPPSLKAPVVEHVDYAGPSRADGLLNRQISVGPSHGYTWHEENRWQFQRARVYTIIEDLFPLAYVNPFIIPMLENAGATVWPVRERDYQFGEVIVDNDGTTRYSVFNETGTWTETDQAGWRGGRVAAMDQQTEPFTLGTTIRATVPADDSTSSTAVYTPYIPSPGKYAVYLSWPMNPLNSASVPVQIRHLGGTTEVRVNQQVAGNTWVFAGFYEFDQGADHDRGSVTYTTHGAARNDGAETYVAADAVRFGGGMGNIAPMDTISYKPRYAEAAMYWLQYAGAPKDAVYLRKFGSDVRFSEDYWSDIAARAEWVNYLNGAPNGPNPQAGKNYRDAPGLGVPMDLFLSFHTDAGFDEEGLIGTLLIYSLEDDIGETEFPDGRTRWLNRDFSVLLQEEVIRTARNKYSSTFARRHVWERNLGESRRPNVPSALIELVSHHNFNDMKYGTDPRFQKDMARAMYKAILRFLAYSEGREPVVQPLEPTHLFAQSLGGGAAEVFWRGQLDPLEPSATPTGYIVYTSDDGRGFDNGQFVETETLRLGDLKPDTDYAFRVTAVNSGGESLPSRTVGLRWSEGKEPVLIVDGFDRISGPEVIHRDRTHGFNREKDMGVYYHYNYGLVGNQYDFDPKHKWENDLESPGMGGSQNLMEDFLEKGNTFDHIVVHGAAFAANGIPYDSATSEAYADGLVSDGYITIDWIAGRQRTIMPYREWDGPGKGDLMEPEFQVLGQGSIANLKRHLEKGGKLILSGAHVVSDLSNGPLSTEESNRFAMESLGVEVGIPDATSTRNVEPESGAFAEVEPFWFGRDLWPPHNLKPTVYTVPRAEGYVSTAIGFEPVLTYGDSEVGAGLAGENVVLFGFPLEAVLPPERRAALIGASIQHFEGGQAEPEE